MVLNDVSWTGINDKAEQDQTASIYRLILIDTLLNGIVAYSKTQVDRGKTSAEAVCV